MRKRIKMARLFLAFILLAFFSFGCAETTINTKIKCAKCSSTYTLDEGLPDIQKSGGGM